MKFFIVRSSDLDLKLTNLEFLDDNVGEFCYISHMKILSLKPTPFLKRNYKIRINLQNPRDHRDIFLPKTERLCLQTRVGIEMGLSFRLSVIQRWRKKKEDEAKHYRRFQWMW